MNLILEIPDSIEAATKWAIACQIRDLQWIRHVVCVERKTSSSSPGFEEIWIECEDHSDKEWDKLAIIRLIAMIVRDWVSVGARLRLQGDEIVDIE